MTTKVNKTRKPAGYWSIEANVRAEATPYTTKKEFAIACQVGYKAARELGIIDELFENVYTTWDEESVEVEASKYNTKSEFRDSCPKAYRAAIKLGTIDELFGNVYKTWDEVSVREEASKYNTKSEFKVGCKSRAYRVALALGIIDDLFDSTYTYWDEDTIRQEALKYSTKKEFQYSCVSGYGAALRLGLIDDLGFTAGATSSDNDMFYIWRVVDLEYKGINVYKYGMTSKRLGDRRVQHVAKRAGVQYDIVLMVNVERATDIEVEASKLGEKVDLGWPEGSTEVRALDDNELWSLKQLALDSAV